MTDQDSAKAKKVARRKPNVTKVSVPVQKARAAKKSKAKARAAKKSKAKASDHDDNDA